MLGHEFGKPRAWLIICTILAAVNQILFLGFGFFIFGTWGIASGVVNIAYGACIIFILTKRPDSVDRAARVIGTAADTMRRAPALVRG